MRTAIRFRGTWLALLAVLAVTILFVNKGPLQDVHWDAPIYLLRGKMVVDTPLLHDYREHAQEIADALPQYKPGVVDTPYWGFMRLGNTLLLGAVADIAGTDMTALQVANVLYVSLMACSLICATLLNLRIVEMLGSGISNKHVISGALVSAGLYLASDMYRYLSGNLVAEVPAIFLVTASLCALVEAVRLRSLALAAVSGVLAFAVYVFKMELVWAYASFAILYAVVLSRNAPTKMHMLAFMVAGLVALAMYALYAWWFYPLANPKLFITFAMAEHSNPLNVVAPVKLWIVAGGMLWVGLLLALRYQFQRPVVWLSLAWLTTVTLPHYHALLQGGIAQARFFAIVMPPLLLASTVGWAGLLDRVESLSAHRMTLPMIVASISVLIALSHSETYRWIRELPGGWRLQSVKSYLSPPPYERLDYPLEELEEITRFLYREDGPTLVVIDKGVPEEYSNIILYFGSRLPDVDQFDSTRKSIGECGRKKLFPDVEPVMFCTVPPSDRTVQDANGKIRLLQLRRLDSLVDSEDPFLARALFRTKGLLLLPFDLCRGDTAATSSGSSQIIGSPECGHVVAVQSGVLADTGSGER